MWRVKREKPHLRFQWCWASTWGGSSAGQTMETGQRTVSGWLWKLVCALFALFFICNVSLVCLWCQFKMSPTEPVGGPVMMTYECDMGENYAVVHLRFFCKVAKGSHPSYKWFLNNTLLSEQQSFYRVDNQPPGESMLLLSVGRESAGTYHCDASDSFDNTTSISSMKLYMDKEGTADPRLSRLLAHVCDGWVSSLLLRFSAEPPSCPGGGGRLWMFHSPHSPGLRLLLRWSGVQWVHRFFHSVSVCVVWLYCTWNNNNWSLSFQGEGDLERILCESLTFKSESLRTGD